MRETAALQASQQLYWYVSLVTSYPAHLYRTLIIVWLQQAVTVVARGSVAGSRDAQNVSVSVVAKDGGER